MENTTTNATSSVAAESKKKSFISYPGGNLPLSISYILLFSIWGLSYFILIPVSANLIATSSLIIFIGCHRSLKLPAVVTNSDGTVSTDKKETISAEDAYKFPLFGSAALFSFYIAFKFFDKDVINLLLSLYFSLGGTYTLTNTLSPFLSQFITSKTKYGYHFKKIYLIGDIDTTFTIADFISFILSCIFSVQYFRTKHFILNNVLGISFCVQAIEKISLGSYKVGAILLVGLFFYDIFWVFGTEVMVTVAKSLDGPIKLLFPRVLPSFGSKGEFSLLGLGDIVIPGLFIALMLRFDALLAYVNPAIAEYSKFPKPYFLVNIIGYMLGLVVTVSVMFFFKAAQPALLYLVPACLGSSLLVAFVKGEVKALIAYAEEDPKDKKKSE